MKQHVIKEKLDLPQSSLVEFLVYDYMTEELGVKYKRGKHKGKLRTYKQITNREYQWICGEESVGKALMKVLSEHKRHESGLWDKFRHALIGA
ncbi:hypothetical protein [Algivirga pacifica]|uniref:Transposase n=1 Tax=Algivirga pacifica TaxID=1162670 RepID=A0ABP9CYR7_9BACT